MASKKKVAAAPTALEVTHTVALAKPKTCGAAFSALVTAYSDEVATVYSAEKCRRLPRHLGDHKTEKPRGLMTAAEKARQSAARTTTRVTSRRRRTPRVSLAAFQAAIVANGNGEMTDAEFNSISMAYIKTYGQRKARAAARAIVTPA